MNADVEKHQQKTNQKDGKKDEYRLDEVDVKKDLEEEPAEDSPLKGEYGDSVPQADAKENDTAAAAAPGAKDGRSKRIRELLSKSRVKWWIAVLVAIVLLTMVLVGTLLAVEDSDEYLHDTSIRLVKLWPEPNKPKNVISFVHGTLPVEGKIWPTLTAQLDELLARYQPSPNHSKTVIECYDSMPPEGSVCSFNTKPIDLECSKSMNYGYDKGKPCIFFEFNNITDWKPEFFKKQDLDNMSDYPEELPKQQKQNVVLLDCQGNSLVDRENVGKMQYSPERGFPNRYFPYTGQPHYMPPLVAVRFANPAVGIAIGVTCKIWAKNVNYTDDAVPSGSISFNLLVD